MSTTAHDWHCPTAQEELTTGTYDLRLCVRKISGATFTTARVVLTESKTVTQCEWNLTAEYDNVVQIVGVRRVIKRVVVLDQSDYVELMNLAFQAPAAAALESRRLLERIEREHGR